MNINFRYVKVPKNSIAGLLEICPECNNTDQVESEKIDSIKMEIDQPYMCTCNRCKIMWTSYKKNFQRGF
jgi:hypothetical protein